MIPFPEEKARAIRALIFDVDGVMTGGEVIYGPDGEWKVFNVQDGHGLKMAKRAGLKVGLLTGRSSPAVKRRADELEVDFFRDGVKDKGAVFADMLNELKVSAAEVAYVGDDVIDLPPLRMAGLGIAVANGVAEVRAAADWISERRGGQGAVREIIERIMKVQGLWDKAMERYVK